MKKSLRLPLLFQSVIPVDSDIRLADTLLYNMLQLDDHDFILPLGEQLIR